MSESIDFRHIRGMILDMDGVLWRGDKLLPGVPDFFQYLQECAIPYGFATNNSSRSAEYYATKLGNAGIEVQQEQIISSAIATAHYLREDYSPGTRVFVVGEKGLQTTLAKAGFELINHLPYSLENVPELVIAGIDRALTYEKLKTASMYIQQGARFIGTNGDKTFPIPEGLAPGAGSVLAALEAACGQPPQIIGKPGTPMFEIALQRLGTTPEQTVMIGDRLETDILGGNHAGLKTILLLCGVTSPETLKTSEVQPDAVYDNLATLLDALRVSLSDRPQRGK